MENIVKKILVKVCNSKEVINPNIDLLESNILDSLAFINLLMELEDIGIEIQPTQVDKDCFRNVDSIIKLVNLHNNKDCCD